MDTVLDIGIERALLASIMYDPSILDSVCDILDKDDFGYPIHGEIFTTMIELNKLNLPISEEFIRNRANKNIENEMVEILSNSSMLDYMSYAKVIKDLSIKRSLRKLAIKITQQAEITNIDSIDIIDEVESEVFNLRTNNLSKEFRNIKEVIPSLLDDIKKIKSKGNSILSGIDTGFFELNRLTTGFSDGELIVLAARPSMGKTALAINLMESTLKSNKGVAFFSLEMDAEQIVLRMFSSISDIPLQRLKIGDLSDSEWHEFSNICNSKSSYKLYIDDSSNLNISQLKSKLRKLKMKDPSLAFVIIDYLQIMSGINSKDRHLEIAEISRGLKNLARELKLPILALSQLNRSLESRSDRRPMLSDLRESGAIEQDADIILFLYRDAVYQRRDQKEKIEQARKEGKEFPKNEILEEKEIEEAELIIGKHRNGPIGVIKLNLKTSITRFTQAPNDNEMNVSQVNTRMDDIDDIDIPI